MPDIVLAVDSHLVGIRLAWLPSIDESGFEPGMADTSWIGCGPYLWYDPRTIRAVAAEHIAVFGIGEVRGLIEPDPLKLSALVLGDILGPVHRSQIDPGPGREAPHVLVVVILAAGHDPGVQVDRPVDDLLKLWEGLPQQQPVIVRNLVRSQQPHQQGIGFAAPGCSTVSTFVLWSAQELSLSRLWLPDDSSHLVTTN